MTRSLRLPGFLGADECERVIAALRESPAGAATVYGTAEAAKVDSGVRRTTRMQPAAEVRGEIAARLEAVRPALADHFRVTLSSFEEPQFLHYRPGDYFVAHQDGNTRLIRDDTMHRRVSVVLFLNGPESYSGGDLVFHGAWPDWTGRESAGAEAGTLIAFPSETTHEVTPVVQGDRYTVVSFYR